MIEMMKRVLLGLLSALLLMVVSAPTFAQGGDLIDEVSNGDVAFRDEIVGYYFLFSVGKQRGKESGFRLRIMDADMEPVQDFDIELRTGSIALDAKYNGEAICVVFVDPEQSRVHVESFSLAGASLGSRDFKLRPWEINNLAASMTTPESGTSLMLSAVPNKGFVLHLPIPHSSIYAYDMYFLPNDLSEGPDAWVVESGAQSGWAQVGITLYASEDFIVTRILNRRRAIDYSNVIEVRSVADGKLMFTYDPTGAGQAVRVTSGIYEPATNTLVFAGPTFPEGDDIYGGAGTGLSMRRVDMTGKELARADVPWTKSLASLGPEAKAHVASEYGGIFVHRVMARPGGGFVAVAQPFMTFRDAKQWERKSKADPYHDLTIVEFGADFSPGKARSFANPRYDQQMIGEQIVYGAPGQLNLIGTTPTAWSNFNFSQSLPGDGGYVVAYMRDRTPEAKTRSRVLVVITDAGDGPEEKVFVPEAKARYTRWLPGKPGYLLVNDVYADVEKSKVRFEPVD